MSVALFPQISEIEHQLPVYLVGAGFLNQDPICRPQGCSFYQWIQCVSGEGRLHVASREYVVKSGQGMYLYPNEPHSYEATSEPWNVYWVVLGGYQMDALSRLLGLPKSGVYTLKDSTVPLAHIRRAIELLNNESDFVGMECAKISYTFLMDIYRFKEQGEEKEKENREYSNERLQPVFEYIHENYNRVLTLDELSDILDVSNQYLCLLFKRAVHMRPMEYLNRLRVNKSKEWLADKPQLTISEIAEKVGFETPGYFSKMFKRYEGVTPENWRRLNANGYCRHVE